MAEPVLSEYSDGRTAALYHVDVRISAGGIALRGDGISAYWPATGLEIVDATGNDQVLRLGHAEYPGARLSIADPPLQARLHESFPLAARNRRDGRRRDMKRVFWAGGIVAALVAVFFVTLPGIVSTLAGFIPHSMEQQMGESAFGTFTQFVDGADRTCVQPKGLAVLDSIVVRLSDNMNLKHPVDVRVVPSDIVNAVAFPGGRILVFDGLVQQAESAEEVAGVIAHEIGHAYHRHGMEGMIRSSAIDAVVSIFAPGSAGELGAGVGTLLLNQSYGRDAEREADQFAVKHLNGIGVRTDGMAEFFERIGKQERHNSIEAFKYLSSHPASAERSRDIRAGGTGDRDIVSHADWQALRKICARTE